MHTIQSDPSLQQPADTPQTSVTRKKLVFTLLAIIVVTLACPVAVIFNYARDEPLAGLGYAISGVCFIASAFWVAVTIGHIKNVIKDPDQSLLDEPSSTGLLVAIACVPIITGLFANPETVLAALGFGALITIAGIGASVLFAKLLVAEYFKNNASGRFHYNRIYLPTVSDIAVLSLISITLLTAAFAAAYVAQAAFPENATARLGAGIGTLATAQLLTAVALLRPRRLRGTTRRVIISSACSAANGAGIGPMTSSILMNSPIF